MTTTESPPHSGPRTFAVIAIGLILAMTSSARAENERTWWSGALVAGAGGEYSTGDYGDDKNTETWDIPFSAKYVFEEIGLFPLDEVELKVSIPYRRIREPDSNGGRESHSGVGDLGVRVGYFHVPRSKRWPIVGGLVRVRFPTGADDIGTDSTDVSLAFDISNSYELGDDSYPRITPFGRIGYRFNGDPPGRDRDDSLQTSVGAIFRPIWDVGFGLAYDWGASSSGSKVRHELSPFFSWRVTRNLRFGPYGVFGLSSNSVDYAAGLAIRVSLDIEGRREVPIRAGGER